MKQKEKKIAIADDLERRKMAAMIVVDTRMADGVSKVTSTSGKKYTLYRSGKSGKNGVEVDKAMCERGLGSGACSRVLLRRERDQL